MLSLTRVRTATRVTSTRRSTGAASSGLCATAIL
uniref:Uncharacterized protein n=1 Tax=Zea mays TaxID=4577 RepID=B6UB38_MAIZE|nr:hypothetical protein [Zea mays]